MKKVLVVITTAFVKYGGLTNAFMNYYRFMDKTGLQIDIASFNEPDEELLDEVNMAGGKYYRLPDKRQNTLMYFCSFYKLCKGYEVVHIHGNSATMAGELLVAKFNHVGKRLAHCHASKTNHPYLNFLLKPILWYSCTQEIAVSKLAGNWAYKPHDYRLLHNTINTEKYRFNEELRKKIRTKYNISDDTLVIGNVGKINPGKNHKFLLDVLKRIYRNRNNVKLLLIGDGPIREEVERKVAELNISSITIFTGMIKDPYAYYSAMDIFFCPSLYEGFSLATLEAQAAGLRCLVSKEITDEINITGDLVFLDFDVKQWENEFFKITSGQENINLRCKRSDETIKSICQKGFDSRNSGNKLREIYLQ